MGFRFAFHCWLAGAWFGFWLSGFAWANPYLALFGVLSGLTLLTVVWAIFRERRKQERDQLLEAVEAHRAERALVRPANMELVDGLLYSIADRVRGGGRS